MTFPAGLVAILGLAASQFTEPHQQWIDDELLSQGYTRADFSWSRGASPIPQLPLAKLGIERPFDAASALGRLHRAGLNSTWREAMERGVFEGLGLELPTRPNLTAPAKDLGLPPGLNSSVNRLCQALARCDAEVRKALEKLSAPDQRRLIEGLPFLASRGTVSVSFASRGSEEMSTTKALAAKIDVASIVAAGVELARIAEAEAKYLAGLKEDVAGVQRLLVGQMVVEIGGRGANEFTSSDARLTIDLGGNDRYRGRVGAAAGYSSLLIDVAGNDRYESGDLGFGAGLAGVGIGIDLAGSDRGISKSLAFGSGVAGFGLWIDEAGDDQLESVAMSQGYGHLGFGMLVDSAGSDRGRIAAMGQGAGSEMGFGWRLDRSGDDILRAGSLSGMPGGSFAQGWGGMGGIGLVSDGSGDDLCAVEEQGIGVGSRWGLGSLSDLEGEDLYLSEAESEGFGLRKGSGFAFDWKGEGRFSGGSAGGGFGMAVSNNVKELIASSELGWIDGRPLGDLTGRFDAAVAGPVGDETTQMRQSASASLRTALLERRQVESGELLEAWRNGLISRQALDPGLPADLRKELSDRINGALLQSPQLMELLPDSELIGLTTVLDSSLADQNLEIRRTAAATLVRLNSAERRAKAIALLDDPDFWIRQYAFRAVSEFTGDLPGRNEAALELLSDADPRRAATGLRLMWRLRATDRSALFASASTDPRPNLRAEAIRLAGWEAEFREAVSAMRKDPHPGVARAAERLMTARHGR